jgi:hypothetical protein
MFLAYGINQHEKGFRNGFNEYLAYLRATKRVSNTWPDRLGRLSCVEGTF